MHTAMLNKARVPLVCARWIPAINCWPNTLENIVLSFPAARYTCAPLLLLLRRSSVRLLLLRAASHAEEAFLYFSTDYFMCPCLSGPFFKKRKC